MNSKQPLISVIIPTFNLEDFIENTILSVLNQTYCNFEVIVVDDGSTDKTPDILNMFQLNNNKIRVIYQKNQGQAVARNKGMSYAKGQFITFVDGDDKVGQNYLTVMHNQFLSDQLNDIVCVPNQDVDLSQWDDVNLNTSNNTPNIQSYSGVEFTREVFKHNGSRVNVALWGKMYKSQFIRQFTIPENHFFEDLAVLPEIFLNSHKITWVNSPEYFYLVDRTDSTVNKLNEKKITDIFYALDYIEKNVIALSDNSGLEEAYNILLFNNLISAWIWINHHDIDDNDVWKRFQKINMKYILLHIGRVKLSKKAFVLYYMRIILPSYLYKKMKKYIK